MSNFVISQIRTYVPVAVGSVLTWLTTKGLNLDAETQTALITFMTGAIIAIYYFVARVLERRNSKFGAILLGASSQPQYKEAK